MKLKNIVGKKVLIVGYGREGKATHTFLKQVIPGAPIAVVDAKDGPQYLQNQKAFNLAIRSPGVPKRLIRVPYTTATNIFFGNSAGMTIGVTGSKGKSTTASLIFAILKKAGKRVYLVGNIGKPALSALAKEKGTGDIYVFELSSYQLDDIAYSPHISVMTNYFPEHMDYHGSVDAYWQAKKRILAYAKKTDYFVYNCAYPQLTELARTSEATAVPFVAKLPFRQASISLLGTHNRDNVRAAVTVGKILEIPVSTMQEAIVNFRPLPHRLELVGTYRGITFYDDAISTTPESTIAALMTFSNVGALLLGGQDRGYDFSFLANVIAEKQIPVIVLFPDSGNTIREVLRRTSFVPRYLLITDNMNEAVQFVYDHAPKGSTCLLSCASPSYSLWKNFEQKGELFQRCIKQIGKNT